METFRLDSLPLELVALVLDYLSSEELISCLHVSSSWREVVSSFRGLWARRCVHDGLPDPLLQNEDPLISFLSARRQRNYLKACKHRVYQDVRKSDSSATEDSLLPLQVVYAGNGVVVTALFRDRQKTPQAPAAPGRLGTGASFTPYKELKQRFQFECILIDRLSETSVGSTEMVRVGLEDKWKWPVLTKAIAGDDRSWVILRVKQTWIETVWYKIFLPLGGSSSASPMHPPEFSSEHHPSTPYDASCCRSCSTVALVKNKLSMRPPWEFGVDLLRLSRHQQVNQHIVPILHYDQMRLSSDVHTNVVFSAYFFCQVPAKGEDSCKAHKLVLWRTNDHMITVHSIREEEEIPSKPDAVFSPLPQGKTLGLSTAWGHAKMKISSDFKMLGFLISHQFHLWSLETNQKLQTLHLEGIPGLRSWILALGHVYTMFGTLHKGGEVVVVVTQTGEVIWRCQSFLGEGKESNLVQLHHNGMLLEDWMSDVYTLPPRKTPMLLYSSVNSPTCISGLSLY